MGFQAVTLFQKHERVNYNFLNRLITHDETLVHHYDSETNIQLETKVELWLTTLSKKDVSHLDDAILGPALSSDDRIFGLRVLQL